MKHIFKNTLAVLDQKEKKQFGILTILDIFINVVDILSLAALLYLIQFYIQPANSNTLHYLPQWLTDKNSIAPVGIFVLLFAAKNGLGFLIARWQFTFISRIAVRISANNLAGYQQAPYAEFVHTDSSVHIRNIGFQPFDFTQYMLLGVQQIITQVSLSLVAVIAILLFNAKLFCC